MRTASLLLLASLAIAGEPGYREVFDPLLADWPLGPARTARKREAFDRLLGDAGPAKVEAAVRALRMIDDAVATMDARIAAVRASYLEALRKWEQAREDYARDYRRKHGHEPAEWPTPQNVLDDVLRKERLWREETGRRRHEREFHEAVLQRIAEALKALPDRSKPVAALAAGLRDKSVQQRLRCADLLAAAGEGAPLLAASETEGDPGVAGALLALLGAAGAPQRKEALAARLEDPAWQVRAGAIRALGALGVKDLLEARLPKEEGRLRDDLQRALGKEADPGAFFRLPCHSRAVVFCIEVSAATAPVWDRARAQVLAAIDALPEDGLFGLVTFARSAKAWRPRLCASSDANRGAAREFLEKAAPAGETDIWGGLSVGLDLAAQGADALCMFSAGEPDFGTYVDAIQIGQEIWLRARPMGVAIHAVGVSLPKHQEYLQLLTSRTGGSFLSVR